MSRLSSPYREDRTTPAAANAKALDHVRMEATRRRRTAISRIERILPDVNTKQFCEGINRVAPVTINFHPDRLLADGRFVAQALLEDGAYRNQFESGISNGGLGPYRGSYRDRWEERMFGGAYHDVGVESMVRPKYGGLNLMNFLNGACPRFGSCHFRLTDDALRRSTFYFGDSASDPADGGVIDVIEPVLAGLFETLAVNPGATGREDLELDAFIRRIDSATGPEDYLRPALSQELDNYIEAQIHGPITLSADVEALVVDGSFRGTETGNILIQIAQTYDFPVEWIPAFRLDVGDVPTLVPPGEPRRWRTICADGRAARLAQDVTSRFARDRRTLDAAVIGEAAASVNREPDNWSEWGTAEDALTGLKDLWLILVSFGHSDS